MKSLNEKVMDEITEAMATDDMNPRVKGEKLHQLYADGSNETKFVIDALLINLCGFSFETLLKKAQSK